MTQQKTRGATHFQVEKPLVSSGVRPPGIGTVGPMKDAPEARNARQFRLGDRGCSRSVLRRTETAFPGFNGMFTYVTKTASRGACRKFSLRWFSALGSVGQEHRWLEKLHNPGKCFGIWGRKYGLIRITRKRRIWATSRLTKIVGSVIDFCLDYPGIGVAKSPHTVHLRFEAHFFIRPHKVAGTRLKIEPALEQIASGSVSVVEECAEIVLIVPNRGDFATRQSLESQPGLLI